MSSELNFVSFRCQSLYRPCVVALGWTSKCFVIRICAADFGSALKCLKVLKFRLLFFRQAAKCAGLLLKPIQCVLIVAACNLSERLIASIRNWLGISVPEFKDIIISDSGSF